MFEDIRVWMFGNSFTRHFQTKCLIMISNHISHISKHVKSPNRLFHSTMGLYGVYAYMPYIRYREVCQVSSVYRPKRAGEGRDIPDTKHSIYKHYIRHMGILGYGDMKV